LLRERFRCRIDLEIWMRLAKQVVRNAVVHQHRDTRSPVTAEEPGKVSAKIECGGSIETGHLSESLEKQATREAVNFTASGGQTGNRVMV
jgi:hypothetical protein